jgi:sporulation protein YlmC with PRC-barrel domain
VTRLSDLRGKKVRSLDGETLGRVHEVHLNKGKVVAIMCGPGSFIERWTGRKKGKRVAWDVVKRIEADGVVIGPEPSASRSRQGTRRTSGRRLKR